MHTLKTLGLAACFSTMLLPLAQAEDALILGHVEMRGYKVTIISDADGLHYRLQNPETGVHIATLTGETLEAQYPGLHHKLTTSTALPKDGFIWAGK